MPVKIVNFVYFCITHGKFIPISRKRYINFPRVIQKCTKFANFAGLYFPHFKTFCDQTLQFYHFLDALQYCGDEFSHFNFFQKSVHNSVIFCDGQTSARVNLLVNCYSVGEGGFQRE